MAGIRAGRRLRVPYTDPFRVRDRTRFDYHTISCEGPVDPAQRAEIEAQGFELFSSAGPASPDDRRWSYYFRRPAGRA